MTFDCMTPEELALWRENQNARNRGERPCIDCPAWFAAAALALGRCNGRPVQNGRPRSEPKVVEVPLPVLLRREYNREWMRRYRAAAREAA